MQKIAIFDLDRTILRKPSFTLFLFWAALVNRPWRLLLLPIWMGLALCYALRITNRAGFKPAAIRLFLGNPITAARMEDLARRFADWRIASDMAPGARRAIDQDRSQGYCLIMATAAPEFYAQILGEKLGFDAVIASRHERTENGDWLAKIKGENCYAAEKGRRVREWLSDSNPEDARHIKAYSDHPSDAPLFQLADEAVLVGRGGKLRALADQNGWELRDFSR